MLKNLPAFWAVFAENVTGVVYNIDHREQVSPFSRLSLYVLDLFRLREGGGEKDGAAAAQGLSDRR